MYMPHIHAYIHTQQALIWQIRCMELAPEIRRDDVEVARDVLGEVIGLRESARMGRAKGQSGPAGIEENLRERVEVICVCIYIYVCVCVCVYL